MCTCLMTSAVSAQSNTDLATTNELVESPLSISLSSQNIIALENQSIVTIGQYGINNITNITQAGNGSNISTVFQNGNNNNAAIDQIGDGNVVNLLQENNDNNFEILQLGFDNVANVNQLGQQTFIVSQIGNDMVLNITQYIE